MKLDTSVSMGIANLSILLNFYYDFSIDYTKAHPVHDAMAEDYPETVQLAKKWVTEEKLKNPQQFAVQDVYHMMLEELDTLEVVYWVNIENGKD